MGLYGGREERSNRCFGINRMEPRYVRERAALGGDHVNRSVTTKLMGHQGIATSALPTTKKFFHNFLNKVCLIKKSSNQCRRLQTPGCSLGLRMCGSFRVCVSGPSDARSWTKLFLAAGNLWDDRCLSVSTSFLGNTVE